MCVPAESCRRRSIFLQRMGGRAGFSKIVRPEPDHIPIGQHGLETPVNILAGAVGEGIRRLI
jgi:hypothetical protein